MKYIQLFILLIAIQGPIYSQNCNSLQATASELSTIDLINYTFDNGGNYTLGGSFTNPTATGGTPPYWYSWDVIGNYTGYILPIENPQINLNDFFPYDTVQIVLAVTDAQNCYSYDTVTLIIDGFKLSAFPQLCNFNGGDSLRFNFHQFGGLEPFTNYLIYNNDTFSTINTDIYVPFFPDTIIGAYELPTSIIREISFEAYTIDSLGVLSEFSISQFECSNHYLDNFCDSFNMSSQNDTALCENNFYSLNAIPSEGTPPYNYNWYTINDSLSNTSELDLNISTPITYYLSIVDSNQCTLRDTFNISIADTCSQSPLSIQNRFSVKSNFLIFPTIRSSISQNKFHIIKSKGITNYSIRLYDSKGNLILKSKKKLDNTKDLNSMILQNGVYFIRFITNDYIQTEKIIIN